LGRGLAELRQLSVVDAVRVGHDEALRGLPKDLVEPHHGDDAGGNHVAQDHARPHGRKLVLVADQEQPGSRGESRHQVRAQPDVDHRRFVHHQHVGGERPRGVAPEAVLGGSPLE
jgi:hypothetical protein